MTKQEEIRIEGSESVIFKDCVFIAQEKPVEWFNVDEYLKELGLSDAN